MLDEIISLQDKILTAIAGAADADALEAVAPSATWPEAGAAPAPGKDGLGAQEQRPIVGQSRQLKPRTCSRTL